MSAQIAFLIPAEGTRARLHPHLSNGVEVVVLATTIRGKYIEHEVAWVNAGVRYEMWVADHELTFEADTRSVGVGVVGFGQ